MSECRFQGTNFTSGCVSTGKYRNHLWTFIIFFSDPCFSDSKQMGCVFSEQMPTFDLDSFDFLKIH